MRLKICENLRIVSLNTNYFGSYKNVYLVAINYNIKSVLMSEISIYFISTLPRLGFVSPTSLALIDDVTVLVGLFNSSDLLRLKTLIPKARARGITFDR